MSHHFLLTLIGSKTSFFLTLIGRAKHTRHSANNRKTIEVKTSKPNVTIEILLKYYCTTAASSPTPTVRVFSNVYVSVCCLFFHMISQKNNAARIIKLDIKMCHHEFWKSISRGQKVKGQSHEAYKALPARVMVLRWVLASSSPTFTAVQTCSSPDTNTLPCCFNSCIWSQLNLG